MKDLKYEHQSTFLLWGRVKLNFRDRYRKPNVYSKNSSHSQVFLHDTLAQFYRHSPTPKFMLLIINYCILCKLGNGDIQGGITGVSDVRCDVHHEEGRWVQYWKFEKMQIMPLGFEYLESSEKSEKITKILHQYSNYMSKLEDWMADTNGDTAISKFDSGPDF